MRATDSSIRYRSSAIAEERFGAEPMPQGFGASAQPSYEPEQKRRFWSRRMLAASATVVVAVLVGVHFVNASKASEAWSADSSDSSDDPAQVVAALSKLMILPDDPHPVLATVTDASKLASNPFFRGAENGDKVVLFAAAGEAVIYRPSAGKIVNAAVIPAAPAGPPATGS